MNLQLRHPPATPDPDSVPPTSGRRRQRIPREHAVCYHCASNDTMEPFARSDRILLLSRIIPTLRRRYCRACTRHFLAFVR